MFACDSGGMWLKAPFIFQEKKIDGKRRTLKCWALRISSGSETTGMAAHLWTASQPKLITTTGQPLHQTPDCLFLRAAAPPNSLADEFGLSRRSTPGLGAGAIRASRCRELASLLLYLLSLSGGWEGLSDLFPDGIIYVALMHLLQNGNRAHSRIPILC